MHNVCGHPQHSKSIKCLSKTGDIIKGKGKALEILNCTNRIDTFDGIIECLTLYFSDQRTDDCLVADPIGAKPERSETPYNFGNRIQDLLNLLIRKVKAVTVKANIQNFRLQQYNSTTLQAYTKGLVNYLVDQEIRLRRPMTLQHAMSCVIEAENFPYSCNRTSSLNVGHHSIKQQVPLYMKNTKAGSSPTGL